MAYLAASDITVTLLPQDIEYVAGRIFTFPTVSFGNGVLQYKALGIPMPVIGKFGMKKEIKRAFIEQPANGFIYHFDRANHKLRIFLGAARDAITMAAVTAGTPAGSVESANHAHDLVILANNAGAGTGIIAAMANTANHALVSDTAEGDTIPGGNTANKGGVELTTPANSTFTGVALATHTHAITGGGAVAEAALAEMDDGVAPAATTLYMQIIGQ